MARMSWSVEAASVQFDGRSLAPPVRNCYVFSGKTNDGNYQYSELRSSANSPHRDQENLFCQARR